MNAWRAGYLIAGMALVALVSVYIRGEQARVATQSLSVELKQVTVRRELWKEQAAVARLRAPGVIHDRIKVFDAMVEPGDTEISQASQPTARTNESQING